MNGSKFSVNQCPRGHFFRYQLKEFNKTKKACEHRLAASDTRNDEKELVLTENRKTIYDLSASLREVVYIPDAGADATASGPGRIDTSATIGGSHF